VPIRLFSRLRSHQLFPLPNQLLIQVVNQHSNLQCNLRISQRGSQASIRHANLRLVLLCNQHVIRRNVQAHNLAVDRQHSLHINHLVNRFLGRRLNQLLHQVCNQVPDRVVNLRIGQRVDLVLNLVDAHLEAQQCNRLHYLQDSQAYSQVRSQARNQLHSLDHIHQLNLLSDPPCNQRRSHLTHLLANLVYNLQ
jgi:hypothetical protein